jgi:hypothetical protein
MRSNSFSGPTDPVYSCDSEFDSTAYVKLYIVSIRESNNEHPDHHAFKLLDQVHSLNIFENEFNTTSAVSGIAQVWPSF